MGFGGEDWRWGAGGMVLSCSAVVWLERDRHSWVKEGKSSRSGRLSALQVCSQLRRSRQQSSWDAGVWVLTILCYEAPSRESMHGIHDSLTLRPLLLCAQASTLAAAPAACQQGPWQCSLGHTFISAHANNLEVSPGVGQLVPGSVLGRILYVPM